MPSSRKRKKQTSKNNAIRDSEVFHKLYLRPSKLIKKYSLLHSISRGEMGQSQQEANQTILHKGNKGYLKSITARAHRVLGTDSHSPHMVERIVSQDLKPQLPQGFSPGYYQLCQACSCFQKRICVPSLFTISSGVQGSSKALTPGY